MIASITSTTISLSLQISSYSGGTAATSSSSGAAPTVQDSDGDNDRVGHGGGHRGGPVLQALAQALQSLGLQSPAISQTGTTQAPSGTSGTSGTSTDASGGANSLVTALRDFVQALFNAVKNANAETSSSPTNTSAAITANTAATGAGEARGFGGRFSAGLSALITQVSNGNAPAGLQDAFNTLLGDLQANAGSSSSSSSSSSGTAAPVTLQSFLTSLQQSLGYRSASSNAEVGSSVSAIA